MDSLRPSRALLCVLLSACARSCSSDSRAPPPAAPLVHQLHKLAAWRGCGECSTRVTRRWRWAALRGGSSMETSIPDEWTSDGPVYPPSPLYLDTSLADASCLSSVARLASRSCVLRPTSSPPRFVGAEIVRGVLRQACSKAPSKWLITSFAGMPQTQPPVLMLLARDRNPDTTLEATQGQNDSFFSQLPYKCYLGGSICGRLT